MTIDWDDLASAEKTALRRLNRGPYPELPRELGERLVFLRVAEERPTGVGISRFGRELVIDSLLRARQN